MKPRPLGPEELRALSAALREISFFADLSMRDLESVLSMTSLYSYDAGAKVFKKG